MRALAAFASLALLPWTATEAGHDQGCVPTHAAWSDVILIDLTSQGGSLYYWEERDNFFGTTPPVPLSGFVLGGGTWLWEETNGLVGAQRGGVGLVPQCIPFLPCLILDVDPIHDETCGHGPDTLLF